jgi:hypothetical protein
LKLPGRISKKLNFLTNYLILKWKTTLITTIRITLITGGLPGSASGQTIYKIELYENNIPIKIFRTQAKFAIPIIKSEARKAQSRLEKIFPNKHYEIKELF